MPTYVYRFVDSDDTIEVQQSFTEDALTEAVHPVSGTTLPVRKVFTPVGITFKGKGFYKTDSRGSSTASSSSSNGAESSSGSSGSSSSDSASTSTAKPESSSAKPESKSGSGSTHSH